METALRTTVVTLSDDVWMDELASMKVREVTRNHKNVLIEVIEDPKDEFESGDTLIIPITKFRIADNHLCEG